MTETLLQGDCLKLLPTIQDNSIDMILADLPYGMTANKWDSVIPLEDLWKQYERIIKDNGAIVLTASQNCDLSNVMCCGFGVGLSAGAFIYDFSDTDFYGTGEI